jgi:hypothetical protein
MRSVIAITLSVTLPLTSSMPFFVSDRKHDDQQTNELEQRLHRMETFLHDCLVTSSLHMCPVCGSIQTYPQFEGGEYEAPPDCGVCGHEEHLPVLMVRKNCVNAFQEMGSALKPVEYSSRLLAFPGEGGKPPTLREGTREDYCSARRATGFMDMFSTWVHEDLSKQCEEERVISGCTSLSSYKGSLAADVAPRHAEKFYVCEDVHAIEDGSVVINALEEYGYNSCNLKRGVSSSYEIQDGDTCWVYCSQDSCSAAINVVNDDSHFSRCERIMYLHNGAITMPAELLQDAQTCWGKIQQYNEQSESS